MPIPTRFVVEGRSLVRHTLVETGTYLGSTVRWALDAGFKKIRTVDFRLTKSRLDDLSDILQHPRVKVFEGASPDRLAEMCRPDEPTLIYLDAHYCGNGHPAEPIYGQCPLLAELDEILSVPWTVQPWIVIDDAPMFNRPWNEDLRKRFDPKQWPTYDQIVRRLTAFDLKTVDGVIYAFPRD